MATGTFANRPGGFTLKTGSQSLPPYASRQVAKNLRRPLLVLTADGAIPVQPGIVVLAVVGAPIAATLAAPVAADAGIRIQIFCGTAQAHVVTATGLIDDGVTGGAKTTITFTGGFVGQSIELMAYNLHWVVLSANVAAIT